MKFTINEHEYSDDGTGERDLLTDWRTWFFPLLQDVFIVIAAWVAEALGYRDTAVSAAAASTSNAAAVATDKAAAQAALAGAQQAQQLAQAAAGGQAGVGVALLSKSLATATDVVAVHVYDTSRDSDGGARRLKCAHTSWAQEVPSATRGARREFPPVALIVVRAASLVIYDALDLDTTGVPRAFMACSAGAFNNAFRGRSSAVAPTSVCAVQGRIYYTLGGTSGEGLTCLDLAGDQAWFVGTSRWRFNGALSQRNSGVGWTQSAEPASAALPGALVSDLCLHVHARVLPGASLDHMGLPIPTVAVATAAGVSVIHPSGQVYSVTGISAARVLLHDDGRLWISNTAGTEVSVGRLPYATASISVWREGFYARAGVAGALTLVGGDAAQVLAPGATGGAFGLTMLAEQPARLSDGMVAYVTTSYATGWMPGDTRLATLCDGTTGSVAGGTVPDRSYKARTLNVIGTLQRNAAATGADLAAFSGFSASNYLEMPYTADLDFAADFFVRLWFRTTTIGVYEVLWSRGYYTGGAWSGALFQLLVDNSGRLTAYASPNGFSSSDVLTGTAAADSAWHSAALVRRGAAWELWLDDQRVATVAATNAGGNLANSSAVARVGASNDTTTRAPNSSVCLARAGAGAPSPSQLRKMYRDERPLFDSGAKALLGGTSSAVSSLSADDSRGLLAVGTGDGVSVYSGLRRIAYLDGTALGSTIASDTIISVGAGAGYMLIDTAANAGVYHAGAAYQDELAARRVSAGPPLAWDGVTTDAAATTFGRVDVPEGELLVIQAVVSGAQYGPTPGERMALEIMAEVWRPVGGAVTIDGTPGRVLLPKTTDTLDATLIAPAADQIAVRVIGKAGVRMVWGVTWTITKIRSI